MFTKKDIDDFRQSLILGASRKPVAAGAQMEFAEGQTGSERAELAALSVIAQAQRLGRASRRTVIAENADCPEDMRPVMSEAVRKDFLRLLKSVRDAKDNSLLRGADRFLAEQGIRIHPFDVPAAMETRVFELCCGPFENWYLAQAGRSEKEHYHFTGYEITEEDWTDYYPSVRAGFLRDLRRTEPEKAIALLQSVFGGEPAQVRLTLLQTLAVNPGGYDLEFLQSIVKDRSGKVKALVADLIARLPGTEEHDNSLEKAFECLDPGKGRFKIKVKAAIKKSSADLFPAVGYIARIRIADLAEKFGLSSEKFIDKVHKDETALINALIGAALYNRDFDLLSMLIAKGGDDPFEVAIDWEELTGSLSEEELGEVMKRFFEAKKPFFMKQHAVRAEETFILFGPMSMEMFEAFLEGTSWRDLLKELKKDEAGSQGGATLNKLAILTPPEAASRLLEIVSEILPYQSTPAQRYWIFLSSVLSELQSINTVNKG